MKTIAQQLKVKEFPFIIKDSNGNVIYYENSDGLIKDNRPKSVPEYTIEELTKIIGNEFKITI